jgi:hypothetical protein
MEAKQHPFDGNASEARPASLKIARHSVVFASLFGYTPAP